MEDESPSRKKRHRSEKRHKENESTLHPEGSDDKPESLSKKKSKGSKKEDTQSTTDKSKTEKADHLTDSNVPNEEEEPNNEPLFEDHSISTMNQVVARVGQLESHVAVLTNSIAELQRNHSKMLKQIKIMEKRWNVIREAWAEQSDLGDSSTLNKQKKGNLEEHSKKKKNLRKNKYKKEKKKGKLNTNDTTPLNTSATLPQLPDTSENSSGSGEQDLTKRIRSVLCNILHELPTEKK